MAVLKGGELGRRECEGGLLQTQERMVRMSSGQTKELCASRLTFSRPVSPELAVCIAVVVDVTVGVCVTVDVSVTEGVCVTVGVHVHCGFSRQT